MGGFRHVPGCTTEHLGLPCSALLGSQNTGILVQRGNYVTDVAPFAALAAKERVNVTDIAGSEWFVVKSEKTKGSRKQPRVLGFAGVASVAKNKVRIRAVWVRPDFRGEGIGDALSQACLEYGIAAHYPEVEILSWDKRWALRAGFREVGRTQHGATRLVFDCTTVGSTPGR